MKKIDNTHTNVVIQVGDSQNQAQNKTPVCRWELTLKDCETLCHALRARLVDPTISTDDCKKISLKLTEFEEMIGKRSGEKTGGLKI